jgi:hypothetical protein
VKNKAFAALFEPNLFFKSKFFKQGYAHKKDRARFASGSFEYQKAGKAGADF